jgi:hypothetical protein
MMSEALRAVVIGFGLYCGWNAAASLVRVTGAAVRAMVKR